MKKSRKRIGIDIRKFHDFGIGIYIRNIIKYLSRIDDDFDYILFHSNGIELPLDLIKNGNGSWKLVKDNSPNYSIQELISLPCKMVWNKIDLFHSPHYATPLIKPCVGVVTIHDIIHYLFPEFLPNYAAIRYSRFMLKMAARNAKKIITVSQHSKKDIVKHLGVPAEKVEVIYNAVDEEFFKEPEPSLGAKLEKVYGIKGQYLLYVGNYLPHKNLERLFEAFKILLNNLDTPLYLVVVSGGNEQIEKLKILVNKLEIQEQTILLGNIQYRDLPPLYQGALAFVFPSIYEGFGLPVIESLACGTPAVISKSSSLPEVGGDASLYFDPLSSTDIAEKIALIVKDDKLRANLSSKAKEQARKFSWQRAASMTKEVYENALGIS